MNNALVFVQILERLGNLDNDVSRQLFAKVGEANNLVEQLATRSKLENNVVVRFRLGKVNQLDDVGVVKLSHNLDFFEDVGTL